MYKLSSKIIAALLSVTFLATSFSGCRKQSSSSAPQESISPAESISQSSESSSQSASSGAKSILRVGALRGPTGMGLVRLMKDNDEKNASNNYSFIIDGAPDEITGKLVSGELDIAALPTNLAAALYSKTEGALSVIAVNTLGVLYVLSTDEDVTTVADLAGKTVYSSGQGAVPEYVFDYILQGNDLDPAADLTVEYVGEHSELATKLAIGAAEIAVLPQPFVTSVTMKDENIKIALDLTEEWKKVSGGSELVMGCIVVRREILEKNPAAIDAFLAEYASSVDFVNTNVDEAAALIGEYEIMAADVAKAAIPGCNIVCITGEEMQNSLAPFLAILHERNPKSVGGALPDDEFYYKG